MEVAMAYFRHGYRFAWRDIKTTKNLSQDSLSLGLDLKLGPHEYEAVILTT
jgi:hypothetical protein